MPTLTSKEAIKTDAFVIKLGNVDVIVADIYIRVLFYHGLSHEVANMLLEKNIYSLHTTCCWLKYKRLWNNRRTEVTKRYYSSGGDNSVFFI